MPTHPQGKFWLLTIPHYDFVPYLPAKCVWIRGQLERGAAGGEQGYLHWQLCVCFSKKTRLAGAKSVFGDRAHCELARSEAAAEYVWKEETRVEGTQFELGQRPFKRNSDADWDRVKDLAKRGKLDDLPSSIFVQHYRSLRTIAADYSQPTAIERTITVFWGPTGVGKSRRAWEQGGIDAYPKCPLSKFWDGYRGQKCVVIDEFRGGINISHILRWFDRYPVLVDIKGSSTVLQASSIFVTSNLHPKDWYPDLDELTLAALLRRLEIIECPLPLY